MKRIRETFKSYEDYKNFYLKSKGYDLEIDKITDDDKKGIPTYDRYAFALKHAKGKVLDVGSWTGKFPTILKSNGFEVECLEANEAAYKYLKEHTDLTAYNSMIEEFSGKKYDTITCLEVIEHAYDMDKFIEKVKSLLNPKGLFIISTPSDNGCYKDEDNDIHLWTADIYSIEEILRDFQIEEYETGDLIFVKARLI